jgi:hypothetical protein
VVNTGEFEKVAKSKVYDIEKCYQVWEQILISNSKMEGSNKLGITFDSFKSYLRYSAIFIMVNSMLTKLQFVVDKDAIKQLEELGYKISMESSIKYAESIKQAFNKLRNINSKIASKQIELANMIKTGEEIQHQGLNFGAMIAEVSTALGFRVGDDVLLSEYNQYVKLIKSKK